MTRREEIEQQAEITVFPWDEPQEQNKFQDGFIEGAKWADKTMIEKACDWMKEQVYQEYGGGPLERLIPDTRIECFRKVMEE
jgi:hypothetical protein